MKTYTELKCLGIGTAWTLITLSILWEFLDAEAVRVDAGGSAFSDMAFAAVAGCAAAGLATVVLALGYILARKAMEMSGGR